jgi:hypothetical protein
LAGTSRGDRERVSVARSRNERDRSLRVVGELERAADDVREHEGAPHREDELSGDREQTGSAEGQSRAASATGTSATPPTSAISFAIRIASYATLSMSSSPVGGSMNGGVEGIGRRFRRHRYHRCHCPSPRYRRRVTAAAAGARKR